MSSPGLEPVREATAFSEELGKFQTAQNETKNWQLAPRTDSNVPTATGDSQAPGSILLWLESISVIAPRLTL